MSVRYLDSGAVGTEVSPGQEVWAIWGITGEGINVSLIHLITDPNLPMSILHHWQHPFTARVSWQCKSLSHLGSGGRRNQIYKIKTHPTQQPGLSMPSPGSAYLFSVSSFYLLHLSSHLSNLHLIQVLHPFIFLILLFPWTMFLWWVAVIASTVLK